ncbi:MAG: phage/plasmid primase, P4 family [Pseudomonadota bacterium]
MPTHRGRICATAQLDARKAHVCEAAARFAAAGWHVFPVPPGTKRSYKSEKYSGTKWGATTDERQIAADWAKWPDANLGARCGPLSGFFVIDVDTIDGHGRDGFASLHALTELHGDLPETVTAVSPSGSRHYYFRWPVDGNVKNSESKLGGGIDVRGDGGMVVVPPSIKPGEGQYRWENPPGRYAFAECPRWLLQLVREPKAKVKSDLENTCSIADLARIRSKLQTAENDLERDEWVKLALALKTVGGDDLRDDFLEFSYRWPDTELGDPERVWDDAKPTGKLGVGSVFFLLGGGTDLTEDGVALAFTGQHGSALRYDHDAGAWFEWTGDRWRQDGTGLAYSWCRTIARELSDGLDAKVRATARKATFAGGVEKMARTDRAHAVTQEAWDKDPFKLGVPGGVVDLKTGELGAPDPDQGITKQAAVAPTLQAACPLWLRFLQEATAGDAGMVEFLKRWCGYCLTGDTREHALIFLYGPGGNGKSVFLNTVTRILGDYATTAAMDTFTATRGDKHPTELALLRGARMVSASETEEGRAWAEARIKQLTGGDPITARFMRQDFFTYVPQFKLTIVGNHAPALANVDEAARRRFNIIPFTVKPDCPDRQLEAKLEAEWHGILRWIIDGAVALQQSGLERPESIKAATAEYFSEQDLTARWLADECTVELGASYRWETAAELFANWSTYARINGEEPGTSKSFAPRLRRHGLRAVRKSKGVRAWEGVSINRAEGFDHE